MGNLKPIEFAKTPDLYEWEPTVDDLFYVFDGQNVVANYDSKVGKLKDITTLPNYYIKKTHYQKRMDEIVRYMNYFTRFFDPDRDSFFSMMMVKYVVDKNLDMTKRQFIDIVVDRIITPRFVAKCKMMACALYNLNINADTSGKFSNTPKITNPQAYQIVALSFCFKILTPIILHFSNVNHTFNPAVKTEYLKCFDRIFNRTVKIFEKDDVPFYNALCKFVAFRGEKCFRNNQATFHQKQMLRGDTLELYNLHLIRDIVCVKTLYKLDYKQSCVSFIDGVIYRFNKNYLREKYPSKPCEIDSDSASRDSDDSMSHAEAVEMQTYKRDESAAMIADVNNSHVMKLLHEWYGAFHISDDEFNFYYENFKPSKISEFLFTNFYASKFKDSFATMNLNKSDTIFLLICLKRILELYKMPNLAQICTARVYDRYKKNSIRDLKSTESFVNAETYKKVVATKFRNILELPLKENPILQTRIDIINSSYVLLDTDEKINGYQLDHIDANAVSAEYLMFLSMI